MKIAAIATVVVAGNASSQISLLTPVTNMAIVRTAALSKPSLELK